MSSIALPNLTQPVAPQARPPFPSSVTPPQLGQTTNANPLYERSGALERAALAAVNADRPDLANNGDVGGLRRNDPTAQQIQQANAQRNQPTDQVERDIVSLGDRADRLLATYGADGRVAAVRNQIERTLSNAAALAASVERNIAAGRSSVTVTDPTDPAATSREVNRNGVTQVLTTTVDNLSRTTEFAVDDAGGRSRRDFVERTVTQVFSDPAAGSTTASPVAGQPLLQVNNSQSIETVTTVNQDGSVRVTSTTRELIARSDQPGRVEARETVRATLFSRSADGTLNQSISETIRSVTAQFDQATGEIGPVVAGTARTIQTDRAITPGTAASDTAAADPAVLREAINDRSVSARLDQATGALITQTRDNAVSVTLAEGSTRAAVTERLRQTSGRQNVDGSFSASVLDQTTRVRRSEADVITANRQSLTAGVSQRSANGNTTLSVSATERTAGFRAERADANDPIAGNPASVGANERVITRASGTLRQAVASVTERADGSSTASARATEASVSFNRDARDRTREVSSQNTERATATLAAGATQAQTTDRTDAARDQPATVVTRTNPTAPGTVQTQTGAPPSRNETVVGSGTTLTAGAPNRNGRGPTVSVDLAAGTGAGAARPVLGNRPDRVAVTGEAGGPVTASLVEGRAQNSTTSTSTGVNARSSDLRNVAVDGTNRSGSNIARRAPLELSISRPGAGSNQPVDLFQTIAGYNANGRLQTNSSAVRFLATGSAVNTQS
ncbi:MAG: hypothetical protein SF002_06040 [Alphaproteobacteria bacterium]|nr:hypothetical protein [Alphaproteobacteria bacterium]